MIPSKRPPPLTVSVCEPVTMRRQRARARQPPDEVAHCVHLHTEPCLFHSACDPGAPLPIEAGEDAAGPARPSGSVNPDRVSRSSATRERSGDGSELTTDGLRRALRDEFDAHDPFHLFERDGPILGQWQQGPVDGEQCHLAPSVISAIETGLPSSSDNVAITSG